MPSQKHNPVVPAKLSYVTDVGGIPSHNGLRHLASSHIDVIACARADICLKLKAVVPQTLGLSGLDHFPYRILFIIHKCSLQRLAAMVNRVQSLMGGSQPP